MSQNKYNTYIMEDALEAIIDYRGKTPKKSNTGIPTLSAKSVKNNFIDYSNCYYISQEEYNRFMIRGFPKKGDILLTTEAPLGVVAKLDRDDVAIAQRLLTLRGKNGILDNNYLLYYLQSPNGQHLLKSHETGTTVTGIKQAVFRRLEILIPNIEIQRKIASILSALDDKIELNNRMNKNLEEQARAIYKSWFVDFEPWGGVMPSDWRVGKASEIIELHDSKRIPISNFERAKLKKIYPYYGATSIMDYVDNYIFDGIYLLFAEDGTVVDSNGHPILQYVNGRFWVNNHAHILTGSNGFSTEMLFILFGMTNITSIITGAVQPKINQANLNNIEVVIPCREATNSFNNIIQPLFTQIRTTQQESRHLSALRDTLLPKLMSGELDVSEVQ